MINKLPMTLLAQLDDVAIFQTAAFHTAASQTAAFRSSVFEKADVDTTEQKNQQLRQLGSASYGELNLGLHVEDDAVQVLNNRMRLLTAINEQLSAQPLTQPCLPVTSLHWVNQVHGKQVHDVDSVPFSMQPVGADAMISQQAGLGLAIMTADCVPIALYQPASGQIAAIHAGWQGLACGVIKETVARFESPEPIMAWIGVCISQANYEVGRQVCDQLLAGCRANISLSKSNLDNFEQLYTVAVDFQSDAQPDSDAQSHIELGRLHKTADKLSNIAKVSMSKVKLNLPKLAADQLSAVGITVNSDVPVECSYADTRYYSYRRQTHLQQPATGRMALIIVRGIPSTDIAHA